MDKPETIQVDELTEVQYIVYAYCADVYNFPSTVICQKYAHGRWT